ncbi:MAG TPA: ABC transporter substrate-binding protein [Planctomycetota bacterium]|nr:ABC transporter substrate-binding protein [Planctomycetota bacterium]
MLKSMLWTLAAAVALTAAAPARAADETPAQREYTVGWSVWTGWMPFKLMDAKGFLAARAGERGVRVRLVEFKGYMESVQAFSARKLDGCAMTCMEALQPAGAGVRVEAILVNDVSCGGDGVLVRKGMKLEDLKGETVLLEQYSVSHYLLTRALASAGLSERDVRIRNTPGDDAGKAFLTDDSVRCVVTWNPHLFLAVEGGKGAVAFDSTRVPGEIVDLLVMNGQELAKDRAVGAALADAWYDAMRFLSDPRTHEEAVRIMADGAGASVEQFEKMLKGTHIFTESKSAAGFLGGPELKATMSKVKKFSLEHQLIDDDSVEIQLDPSFTAQVK